MYAQNKQEKRREEKSSISYPHTFQYELLPSLKDPKQYLTTRQSEGDDGLRDSRFLVNPHLKTLGTYLKLVASEIGRQVFIYTYITMYITLFYSVVFDSQSHV